jgi:hypothetical protein
MATYTELKASVADWLHRADLTSQVVDFITLAEDELNAKLRLRMMEVDEPLTLSQGSNTVALPSRYLEPILLEIVFPDDRDNKRLAYLSPQQMELFDSSSGRQEPDYWTINGSNIEFPEQADQAYTLRFRMLKRLDIAADTTNNLLSNYRGLYLFGALLQATPYMVDDQRIATWQLMYTNLLNKVMAKESRTNVLANLRSDLPLTRRHSNIFRGY